MSFVKTVFLMVLVLVVQGCETVPADSAVVVKADTIVVLPPTSLHVELDDTYADVQARLAKAVGNKNFKVLVLRGEAWQKLHTEALTVSGSMYDPKMAKVMPLNKGAYNKALIDLVKENNDYDVVLMPALVIRTAIVQGDEAQWDGVEREFTWFQEPEDTYILPSKASGLSLQVTAYTDKGALVYQSYDGISLPYDLRLDKGKFQFELKKHFFTNSELKGAVKAALKTFEKQVELDD